MIRCVAIHANGTSEVIEFRPQVHQELRRLGYRRFVVRTADGRALSSAVYARSVPSHWQFTDAAKKLWGITGDVEVLDDQGELVVDDLTPAAGTPIIPARPMPRADAPAETRVRQPAYVEGQTDTVRKAGVGRETPAWPAAGIGRPVPAPAPQPAAARPADVRPAEVRPKTRIDPRQIPELIARANHSLPDADPRKITRAMVADLARAARAIRQSADEGMAGLDEAQQRALADRLETHARALGSYLRPRPDQAKAPQGD